MVKLGCLKDKFDTRDYLMRAYLPLVKIPKKIDYSKEMSPVRDQGDEGTCVGFATTVGMKEYQEHLDYKKIVTLSPRFIYAECKKIDGMPDEEGTTIRAAMKVLKTKGVCQETFWPYRPHQTDKPKAGAVLNAKKFNTLTYARILNVQELLLSLAAKGPAVIGVYVFEGMMTTKTGVVRCRRKMKAPWRSRDLSGRLRPDKEVDQVQKLLVGKWGKKDMAISPTLIWKNI